jgi:hypothetical protein
MHKSKFSRKDMTSQKTHRNQDDAAKESAPRIFRIIHTIPIDQQRPVISSNDKFSTSKWFSDSKGNTEHCEDWV